VSYLVYEPSGGSSFDLGGYDVILDMDISEILWWYKELGRRREEEAEQMKR
jgi:hypothetical protein